MPSAPPLYLQDLNGKVWLIVVAANGQLGKVAATPPLSAPLSVLINDLQSGEVWTLSLDVNGDIDQNQAPPASSTTVNQIPVASAGGSLYFIQITNGALMTVAGSYPCNTPISTLSLGVLARLEENFPPGGPIFWDLSTEVYSALVEAMNDLLLLVGRPTQAVQQVITLTPNTVWQKTPKGIFLITDLYGNNQIRQANLASMDYVQASWLGDWEQDVADSPLRWGAVGFNFFFVHPAPSTAIQLTLTGIQYPALDNWPYTGGELSPFHHEFQLALELYAASYCRLKETGAEAQEGITLYAQYLELAKRLTQLEDLRDPVIFSKALGAPTQVEVTTKR
jgi:hypothetical protein